jgi:hypothetical protein
MSPARGSHGRAPAEKKKFPKNNRHENTRDKKNHRNFLDKIGGNKLTARKMEEQKLKSMIGSNSFFLKE